MSDEYDEILVGLFHACAWEAYLHQSHAQQGWPHPEATRQRAFAHYEQALPEKSRRTFARPEAMSCPVRIANAAA
jgi:hypothetical protein